MNFTSVALMTQTVVSVGLIRVLSGMVPGAEIALRLAIIVGVEELRLIKSASASVPVFTVHRSELHWAETRVTANSTTTAQIANLISSLVELARTLCLNRT